MSVLSTIQSVCAKVGIDPVPTSVFSQADRTSVELKETANECAAQIVREFDWNELVKVGSLTGDGETTEYPLSSLAPDFQRFTERAELWMDTLGYGNLYHIDNINDWLQQENWSLGWMGGAWTMYGGSLFVRAGTDEALTEDQTVRFGYVSKNYARSENGTLKDSFTTDSDGFVLSERLLKLCMIWNWKSAHGQSYSQEFEDYQNALEELRISNKTPSVIRSGRRMYYPYGPAGFR